MTEQPRVAHTPETEPLERDLASKRSTAAQWFGLIAPPLAMLANQQAQYALVPWACYSGLHFVVHIPPVIFLAITALAGLAARREWRAGGGGEPGTESGIFARARFLGAIGVGASVLFAAIIAAMWVADAFLNTCDGS
jgi:hypothetical protein